MKTGLLISLFLHSVTILGGIFIFSGKVEPIASGRYIPVELVDIKEETNIRAAKKAEKPEDIKAVKAPAPIVNAAPDVNTLEEQTKVRPPTPETVDTILKAEAVPVTKPVDKKPKSTFDLNRISALVDKSRKEQMQTAHQAALPPESRYEFARTARAEQGLGTKLTISELQALQSRMYQCWRVSVDAENPQDLSVRVRVQLYENGEVKDVTLLGKARIYASRDPYLKIAAERAVRAVSKCAPYSFLSAEKYSTWKDMELTFRPEI